MPFLLVLLLLAAAPLSAQTLGSWERMPNRSEFTLWDLTCTDSLHCYAVGDYGVMLFSTDGGESWTQKLSPNQLALRNIHFFDDSSAIAAGFRGSCFLTTDRGESWASVVLPGEITYPGMSVVGNTVWLSGEDGAMLKSVNRGITWKKLDSGTDVMLDGISFADERHGWASSVQRKLLRSTDGGDSWHEQQIDAFLPVTTVHARSAQECWVAGYHGLIMRTTDGGSTWQRMHAYETDYLALSFDDRGTGWAVGKRGAIVRAEEGNLRWRLHDLTTAESLHAITFLPNNQAIAAGIHGLLFKQRELHPPAPAPAQEQP
jgi:photosystem II stability/assembly factor-like uncharacterized protein